MRDLELGISRVFFALGLGHTHKSMTLLFQEMSICTTLDTKIA